MILVTGAAGFSGNHLVNKLLSFGKEVRGTDIIKTNNQRRKAHQRNYEFVKADLTNYEDMKKVTKDIDVIYHPAALFDYSASLELLNNINVRGTEKLIHAAIENNVERMILWGSVASYGEANPNWYRIPITENQMPNPDLGGNYNESKRKQEEIARLKYILYGFPVTIIRPAPIYGENSYYGIYTLFKYIQQGSLSVVPRNLHKSSIPLVHVEDIARAAIYLADRPDTIGKTYNVVDDNTLDMVQTLKWVAYLTGHKMKVLLPIPMKGLRKPLERFGKFSAWEAKHLRKKINGKSPVPKLETDTVSYMFGNYHFSNQKIKDTGFKFKYPDRKIGLINVIDWYNKNGWKQPMR